MKSRLTPACIHAERVLYFGMDNNGLAALSGNLHLGHPRHCRCCRQARPKRVPAIPSGVFADGLDRRLHDLGHGLALEPTLTDAPVLTHRPKQWPAPASFGFRWAPGPATDAAAGKFPF